MDGFPLWFWGLLSTVSIIVSIGLVFLFYRVRIGDVENYIYGKFPRKNEKAQTDKFMSLLMLQTYRSCKEKMGGGGVAMPYSREEQSQCHLCRWKVVLHTKCNDNNNGNGNGNVNGNWQQQ